VDEIQDYYKENYEKMIKIARLTHNVLTNIGDEMVEKEAAEAVSQMCKKFPISGFSC